MRPHPPEVRFILVPVRPSDPRVSRGVTGPLVEVFPGLGGGPKGSTVVPSHGCDEGRRGV